MKTVDFTFQNHGSLSLLQPITEPAREWLQDNIEGDHQYYGGALVIEHRYVDNLIAGIIEEGFRIGNGAAGLH